MSEDDTSKKLLDLHKKKYIKKRGFASLLNAFVHNLWTYLHSDTLDIITLTLYLLDR